MTTKTSNIDMPDSEITLFPVPTLSQLEEALEERTSPDRRSGSSDDKNKDVERRSGDRRKDSA